LSPFDLLRIAHAAAEAGASYLRSASRPGDPAAWSAKDQRDYVTHVDRTSEERIRAVLAEATPAARIVGEELSPEIVTQGLVWIVDPLDGTTNFLHGVPTWAVSIAAAVDGVLQAGIVFDVPADERFQAALGGGATLNDHPLSVSSIAAPEHALIGTGFPFRDVSRIDAYLAQFKRIASATSGIRRPGAAAIDLAWVAAGRFDGFWEQSLAPWDVAAGILLVREAGGVVTDHAGHSELLRPGTSVAAGNVHIHPWLLKQLDLP
jgi:myo-inositol-1(or 4)-monophosphatase